MTALQEHGIIAPIILVLALTLSGCTGPASPTAVRPTSTAEATAAVSPPPSTAMPSRTSTSTSQPTPTAARAAFQPKVEVVASGLEVPWALAFAPDSRLFFTERPGRVRVMDKGRLVLDPVATLPVASVGEAGLMGLVLDPDFARNGYLYVMYTYRDGQNRLRSRVSRLTERANKAAEEKALLEGIPGANIHDGGRLKFGPDGKLYITTGDASDTSQSQNLASLAGKVLRLNSDGSIPSDNPFPGSPVYSYGHRNPQGLAWHPTSGRLFSTEHGPVGNDEVNIIQTGRNYGWPELSGKGGAPKYIDPIISFAPSVAPSGATFYSGSELAPWKGNLFFTTLVGQHLHRIVLNSDLTGVERDERLFSGEYGRLRDVIQGPDGFLYFATSNRDGRGRPSSEDDRILRIVPGS